MMEESVRIVHFYTVRYLDCSSSMQAVDYILNSWIFMCLFAFITLLQVAQLSQRVHAAGWVSFGRKWKRKSSFNMNRKSTTSLPMSLRWTVYVAPKLPKGGSKTKVSTIWTIIRDNFETVIVVDFLFVLIELFSLVVTAEVLQANIK